MQEEVPLLGIPRSRAIRCCRVNINDNWELREMWIGIQGKQRYDGESEKSVPDAAHFFSLATGETVFYIFFFICSPQMVKSAQ